MIIELNKDFLKEYKDNAWKGFSTKELLSIIVAGVSAVIIDVCLYKYADIDPSTGVYIAIPVVIPILLFGFYKFQGFFSIVEISKEIMYYFKTRQLLYDSCEGKKRDDYIRFSYELLPSGNNAKVKQAKKTSRKRKRQGIMYMSPKELKGRIKAKKMQKAKQKSYLLKSALESLTNIKKRSKADEEAN